MYSAGVLATHAFTGSLSIDGELWLPDSAEHANSTFMSILSAINRTEVNQQDKLLCLFVSAIVTAFPDLKEVAEELLGCHEIRVREIKIPSQAAANRIEVVQQAPMDKYFIMLGQMIIVVYKDLKNMNYSQFMARKIEEMKDALPISLSTHMSDLLAIRDHAKVMLIRTRIGPCYSFRAKLIMNVINGSNAVNPLIKSLNTYVTNVLKYTDMAGYALIVETLVYPKSPVLMHLIVASEVNNLAVAVRAVTRTEYPEFFRILKPFDGRLVERGRFPVLLSVAQKLKMSSTPNFRFSPPSGINQHMVNTLVEFHNCAIRGSLVADRPSTRFLYSQSAPASSAPQTETVNQGSSNVRGTGGSNQG